MYYEIDFDSSKSKVAYIALKELEEISEMSYGPSADWMEYRREKADELYYKVAWNWHYRDLINKQLGKWREPLRYIESCKRRRKKPTEVELDAFVTHPDDVISRETIKAFAISDRQLALFFANVRKMRTKELDMLLKLQGRRRKVSNFNGDEAIRMYADREVRLDFIFSKDLPELACPVQY